MIEKDEWGGDPSVKAMRRVFSRMETSQKELLETLGISPFDNRLRRCREEARILFERTLSSKAARTEGLDEEETAALYILCLSRTLDRGGIRVRPEVCQDDNRLNGLIREALK